MSEMHDRMPLKGYHKNANVILWLLFLLFYIMFLKHVITKHLHIEPLY